MSNTTIGIIVITGLFMLHWMLSIAIQSIFYHRYGAHGMFKFTNKNSEKLMYILSLIFLGPSYLSPRAYTILHRMHHAYADTDKDPHRPYFGFWGVFKTTKLTANRYSAIFKEKDSINIDGQEVFIEDKFKKNVTDWYTFDQIFHSWIIRVSFVIAYIIIYDYLINYFNLSPLFFLMVIPHSIMAPLHGAIINYYAHKYGDAPHKMDDTSKNMPWLARFILSLNGEPLHNNHHAEPSNPDFSLGRKGEIDTGYKFILKPMEKLGFIKFKTAI